jgi:hypothetical protein
LSGVRRGAQGNLGKEGGEEVTDELKSDPKPIGVIDLLFWLMVLTPPMALLLGWAVSLIWSWFVVPLGVAPVGVLHAAGMALGFRLVVMAKTEPSKKHPVQVAVEGSVMLLAMLGICYLIKLGMGVTS